MADLKAAAETLAVFRKNIMRDNYCDCRACNPANLPESNGWKCVTSYRADALLLAAQALEALAWQAEKEAKVIPWGHEWRCSDGEKIRAHADTPLGAILAAMEGEKSEG